MRPDPRPVQPSTVLALSIGIGGHLTMPPLPHHRAYGSVPRRFGGLSVQQLFHGRQAQTTEVRIGEGAVHCFRGTQSPRSLWAEDGRTGRPFGDLETTEFAIALPRVFHWTQTTQRRRRRIQPSRDCNSRHWLMPK